MQEEQFVELLKRAADIMKEGTLRELLKGDKSYEKATKEADMAEKRYLQLHLLPEQKEIVNELLQCRDQSYYHYSVLAYMAGIKDSFQFIKYSDSCKQ